jgi:DNA-binding IclR family transcriptional regulator
MSSPSPYQLESVERALRVLDCFREDTPELRLVDIGRLLGISKVQALRLASTLESHGFLTRDPRTKYYRLGLRLFQLGMVVQQQSELQRVAHPFLHELVVKTGETARLMVPHPLGPTCLDLVESPRQYRVFGKLGGPRPWHAGTSTKLLLAYQPEEKQDDVLAQPLIRYTSETTTDPDILRSQLANIREHGYHVSSNDIEEGGTAIAAPVFDRSGEVAGAISVSGPTDRIMETGIERVLMWVRASAGDVSRSLGHFSSLDGHIGESMRAQLWEQ